MAPESHPFLPYARPSIGEEEIAEVIDTLHNGWLSTGPKTGRFEEAFREYTGAKHAVALNSCTAALHLALMALGVGPEDEVITTTLTFAATGNMIAALGARPILADIEPLHGNIDINAIIGKITPRTKGIIVVHYAGHPCRMKEINALAKQHGLFVLEDAAHAIGSEYNGKKIGSGENPTCFSFYPTKTMTTGEGGMLTTNSAALAKKVRRLSLHGISKDAWKRYTKEGAWFYQVTDCGYKYNMSDVQASLGLVQLKRLEQFIQTRTAYADMYDEALRSIEGITPPTAPDKNVRHSLHLYPIKIDSRKLGISRNDFIKALKEKGIGTSVHFIPLHMHPYYRKQFGYRAHDLPVAKTIYESMISLPLYPEMTEQDVRRVICAVQAIASKPAIARAH